MNTSRVQENAGQEQLFLDRPSPTAEQVPFNAMTLVQQQRENLSRSKNYEHAKTAPCPFCFTTT